MMEAKLIKIENEIARGAYGIYKSFLSLIIFLTKTTLLAAVLLLFGGHETANPKLGNTTVEFYSQEIRSGIQSAFATRIQDSTKSNLISNMAYEFYATRHNLPAWTLNFELNNNYKDLQKLLESAEEYGLFPSDYLVNEHAELIEKMYTIGNDQQRINARIKLEYLTTYSALNFIIHLIAGYNMPDSLLMQREIICELPVFLNSALLDQDLKKAVLNVQPKNEQYALLQLALAKYVNAVEINSDSYDPALLEDNYELLKEILIQHGYLNSQKINDSLTVAKAVMRFQELNRLKPTGIINRKTSMALVISTNERFYQIALNLDRLRKDNINDKSFILVNIPEYKLHYTDNDGKISRYNVIVGKQITPTPELESKIDRIVANPYWTVPRSIAFNEIIPKVQSDSMYLSKHGYAIIDNYENLVDMSEFDWNSIDQKEFKYWIRQKNSRSNSLGLVKFLFPNEHSVYLHDTPSRNLFSKTIRAFSHGCVRVQDPEKLAQQIIANNYDMDRKHVDFSDLILSKDHCEIKLSAQLPIYIRYYTCTADSSGNIYFYPDIYSHDKQAIQELFGNTAMN